MERQYYVVEKIHALKIKKNKIKNKSFEVRERKRVGEIERRGERERKRRGGWRRRQGVSEKE